MLPPPDVPAYVPVSAGSDVGRFASWLAVVPFAIAFGLMIAGVDFGTHWDEPHNKINALAYSLEHDFTLLPDGYNYPGVNYGLTLLAASPEMAQALLKVGPDPEALRAELLPYIRSEAFLLRLRGIYITVTAASAAWVFLALLYWNGNVIGAFFGSLLFATSPEVLYHGRWAAPDTVLMQFGALVLLLLVLAWKRRSLGALRWAAIAAGFGCGSKYPGALLLAPVLLAAVLLVLRGAGWRGAVRHVVTLGMMFFIAYALTTPGTFLQPVIFYQSLKFSWDVYATGWYGYTVVPGLEHLGKIIVYFATALFSGLRPVALVAFAFAIAGSIVLVRRNRLGGAVLLAFPILYLLYFSRQAAMVVRNYLVVVPFVAFFAAQGWSWLQGFVPRGAARVAAVTGIFGLIGIGLVSEIAATVSIVHRHDTSRFLDEFIAYAGKRSEGILLVSSRLADDLRARGQWPLAHLVEVTPEAPHDFAAYASYYSETVKPRELQWPTNQPGSFVAVFGPREVNLDYYTGWSGQDRIIVLSPAIARAQGIVLP